MTELIITVEDLSKCYRIGEKEQGYKTFREAIMDGFMAPIRNFKSLRKLTKFESDSFGQAHLAGQEDAPDIIWALKGLSFEVKQGEVLGIIGRNGAGKSTLLKILSRITEPTTGDIKTYGRISSLLEVGTGFHPELTGRENIYLNGAILGMRKGEIDRKFDEIISFSGIEKFIDTPVKRYSSGMYVRLAFAVAAHLESEILLVDEVLAVGDYEFQKKCLEKMGEIGKEGRTVLLVSHNLNSIASLCSYSLLLDQGSLLKMGDTRQVISYYLSSTRLRAAEMIWSNPAEAPGNSQTRLHAVRTKTADGRVTDDFDIQEEIIIQVCYWNLSEGSDQKVTLYLHDELKSYVLASANLPSENISEDEWFRVPMPVGLFVTECRIPPNFLNMQTYNIGIAIGSIPGYSAADVINWEVLSFTVHDYSGRDKYSLRAGGVVHPKLAWSTRYLDSTVPTQSSSTDNRRL
jgi:lipopolysaccharide transport system ATP-binding protein